MSSPELEQAIQLIRTGRKAEARKLLEPLIAKEPQNISAWFWYVEIWPEPAKKIQVLETCLKFNPTNPQVQTVYLKLKGAVQATPPPPEPVVPVIAPIPAPSPITPSSVSQLPPPVKPARKSATQGYLRGILALTVGIVLVAVGYLGWDFLTRGDQGPVLLRLNLEQGRTYTERIVSDANMGVWLIPGGSQKIGYRFAYTLDGATSDGNLQIRVAFDWVRMELKYPGKSLMFDSTQPGGDIPPEFAGYAALPGKTLGLSVSPQGKLFDVRGGEKILSSALQNISAEATADDIQQQVGQQALVDMFAGAFPIYAPHPVAIGETWQANYSLKASIPMNVNCTYKLIERRRGVASIASDCTLGSRDDLVKVDGVDMVYEVNGTLKGVVRVDEQSGWLVSGEAKNEISVTSLEPFKIYLSKPQAITLKSSIVIDQAGVK
jgi:hypothetical protein